MAANILPTKLGQVCRITVTFEDECPDDVYLVSEDPTPYHENSMLYVTNLRDLQKNINSPFITPLKGVKKSDLSVIADSMEDYIASWN